MKKLLLSTAFILAATLSNMASADERECISVYELPHARASSQEDYVASCTKHCTDKKMSYSNVILSGKDCPNYNNDQFYCFCR